jgi:hypothetical protein
MPRLPAFGQSRTLAIMLAGALMVLLAISVAEAQQSPKGNEGGQGPYYVQQGPRGGVGGYSLRLSDIWGPAKMPPAPKDFGPHFDFPPEPLNGAPLHDPYPN